MCAICPTTRQVPVSKISMIANITRFGNSSTTTYAILRNSTTISKKKDYGHELINDKWATYLIGRFVATRHKKLNHDESEGSHAAALMLKYITSREYRRTSLFNMYNT